MLFRTGWFLASVFLLAASFVHDVDGFSTTRELVVYQLFGDWMPELSLDSMAMTIEELQSSERPPDPNGEPFVQKLDSWGPWLQLDAESTHSTLCGALNGTLSSRLGSPPESQPRAFKNSITRCLTCLWQNLPSFRDGSDFSAGRIDRQKLVVVR